MNVPAPLQVLIVDDEPLARLRLRQLVERCAQPSAQVADEAGHAGAALAALDRRPVDAVLLDIRMPGPDGLALAQQLARRPRPPAVIFVTAHGTHALEAFELAAVDYLTKPVRQERLQEALRRVAARRLESADATTLAAARSAGPADGPAAPPTPAPAPVPAEGASPGATPPHAPALHIRERTRSLRIPSADLVWARAEHKQVVLVTGTREHVVDLSLTELEQQMGEGFFVRVHRNALAARHALRELRRRVDADGDEAWAVRLVPGEHWVPVSRRLLAAVKAAMGR